MHYYKGQEMLRFQLQRHELFECQLQISGIPYGSLKPRLILVSSNGKESQYEGRFVNDICSIPVFIKEGKPEKGTAILEVIIDEDEYIRPWESPYEAFTYKILSETGKKPDEKIPNVSKEDIHNIIDFIDLRK
jgi:hypothetical protein